MIAKMTGKPVLVLPAGRATGLLCLYQNMRCYFVRARKESNLPRYMDFVFQNFLLSMEITELVIFKSSMVRLTQELIVLAPQFTNALKEREIDLRGLFLLFVAQL